MQLPMTIFFLSTTVLAVPTKPALQPREWTSPELGLRVTNAGYQGDGFYLAVFNESGVADVRFTPFSDLGDIEPALASSSVAPPTTDSEPLAKRWGTNCSGGRSRNQADLDSANSQLVNNAVSMANQGDYHHWGWVHWGEQTAYFCNFQSNTITRTLITDMQSIITDKCGADGYGIDRRTNCCGANDFAVGKTARGREFCESEFRG